jgi:hypothetical protein
MAKMSMVTRKELLKSSRKRYLKSPKEDKTKILNELVENTGMVRKYIIRKLSPKISYSPRQRKKRKNKYDNEVVYHLKKIWETYDYACGQNLADTMKSIVEVMIRKKHLKVSSELENKILEISSSTIDRKLSRFKKLQRKKINSTTKPGTLLKQQIAIRTSSWKEDRLGCCELDTVAHCGDSASGEFAITVDLTDILTQWTESYAILGKSAKGVVKALESIRNRLPFELVAIDPDNGSELVSWPMYKYTVKEKIEFTRGRPYHKNDNAHIEQKNWTHIRKYFGKRRLETQKAVSKMNDLYENELRLYKNFFIANKKLISKKYVGAKTKKKYDKAKTPYQRILEDKKVDKKVKEQLMSRTRFFGHDYRVK